MNDAADYVPAEGLDLDQAQRRRIREHQPADRRADARKGAAGRPPPAATLFAGDAERRQGHDHAGGAAGARARRRRIRRVADQDRRGRSVRQRLRGDQSELQDSGVAGPERAEADPGIRIRLDPAVSRREVRRVPADGGRGARAECLSWLFWQMGSAPYLGGGFGHFYAYAPTKIEYAIDRFAMEVKRQLDVLDRRLAETEYIAGDAYTIADMAIFPWYGGLVKGWSYDAAEFLSVQDYKNVQRWADAAARAAGREARAHGQPHVRRAVEPAARAPRRQRLRDEDAGQADGAQ